MVDFIIKKCQDAFQEEDNESAQILLDNIDCATFEQANEMVDQLNEDYE